MTRSRLPPSSRRPRSRLPLDPLSLQRAPANDNRPARRLAAALEGARLSASEEELAEALVDSFMAHILEGRR